MLLPPNLIFVFLSPSYVEEKNYTDGKSALNVPSSDKEARLAGCRAWWEIVVIELLCAINKGVRPQTERAVVVQTF